MTNREINFYSDTQTRPSRAMLETALTAEVGDEQSGRDPTTNALCERMAAMMGHEAAVFLPSGTMCNEIALAVHGRPGDEVICDKTSHIVGFEGGGPAALSGLMMATLNGDRGRFTAEQVAEAIRPASRYSPVSRIVSVEQTANMGGGAVWPLAQIQSVVQTARDAGLTLHMDGARLMNAVVAGGVPAADQAGLMDSAWVDFTKGLGAPVGAVLVGSSEFIDRAWRFKQMWGGAMRQSGVVAAMCLYALDHNIDRLADDHAMAGRIAAQLQSLSGVAQVLKPDTNIVIFDLTDDAPDANVVVNEMAAKGIRFGALSARRMRIVTHLDVGSDEEAALAKALTEVLG